jgi:hypothetical protein
MIHKCQVAAQRGKSSSGEIFSRILFCTQHIQGLCREYKARGVPNFNNKEIFMDGICNSPSQCREYYAEELAGIAAQKEAEKAATAAKAAEYAKSPAAFKRDDYEKIAAMEAAEQNSFTAQAKRFAQTALEVIGGLQPVAPREKVMP